jgi:hypothetical protein
MPLPHCHRATCALPLGRFVGILRVPMLTLPGWSSLVLQSLCTLCAMLSRPRLSVCDATVGFKPPAPCSKIPGPSCQFQIPNHVTAKCHLPVPCMSLSPNTRPTDPLQTAARSHARNNAIGHAKISHAAMPEAMPPGPMLTLSSSLSRFCLVFP